MKLKTVLFSMLIIAIAFTAGAEARKRSKPRNRSTSNKQSTQHSESILNKSGSGHNKRGSAGEHHAVVSQHHNTADRNSKQHTHDSNTEVAKTHSNTHVANTPESPHNFNQPESYPKQQTAIPNNGDTIVNTPQQPVYIVNAQQPNTQSSGTDDFAAGYVAGANSARRKLRRRKTTTTTTTVAPTTVTNPCITGTPVPDKIVNNELQQNPGVNCDPTSITPTPTTYQNPPLAAII
ncbi:uncharacterized protein LOC119614858 [Lucilia sericata]|uniref:uncharacterized protein LOC119614858 n=1 Tax=Lucilia sericata TaxID=13632 RepID=UPI0018A7FF4E|nr:uncharacterized protein LOC119614858 [Lucilia sericata]